MDQVGCERAGAAPNSINKNNVPCAIRRDEAMAYLNSPGRARPARFGDVRWCHIGPHRAGRTTSIRGCPAAAVYVLRAVHSDADHLNGRGRTIAGIGLGRADFVDDIHTRIHLAEDGMLRGTRREEVEVAVVNSVDEELA